METLAGNSSFGEHLSRVWALRESWPQDGEWNPHSPLMGGFRASGCGWVTKWIRLQPFFLALLKPFGHLAKPHGAAGSCVSNLTNHQVYIHC